MGCQWCFFYIHLTNKMEISRKIVIKECSQVEQINKERLKKRLLSYFQHQDLKKYFDDLKQHIFFYNILVYKFCYSTSKLFNNSYFNLQVPRKIMGQCLDLILCVFLSKLGFLTKTCIKRISEQCFSVHEKSYTKLKFVWLSTIVKRKNEDETCLPVCDVLHTLR